METGRHNPKRIERKKGSKLSWYSLTLKGMTRKDAVVGITVYFQAFDDEEAKKKVPSEIHSLKLKKVSSKKLVREIPL